jgi:hypothetical protein
MPKPLKVQYIRDRLPVVYRYHQGFRWFMILISMMMVIYSLYFLLSFVHSDTPMFYKILPLIICFVGLDSILRKVTSLNSITFMQDQIKLGFIAKKDIVIPYDSIQSIDLLRKITYYTQISYRNSTGVLRQLNTPASFPHILEIILNLADLAPHAAIPDKLQGVLDYLKANAQDEL